MNATTLPTSFGRLVIGMLSLLCFALLSTQVSAQEVSLEECAGGTLFFISYPDTVTNAQDARFADRKAEEFFLLIYSAVDQKVKIGRANGASTTEPLIGGEVLEFDTKKVAVPLVSVRNSPQTNVLKVESESPVVIYAYMATRFGCAAFTPIPVESWGTEYYSSSFAGEFVRDIQPAGENNFDASVKVPAPAQILVIAAYDNTQVRINPTGALASCANCQTVKLNAGEAYLVQSFVDTNESVEIQQDIAGSSITANKRIGVVSGNTRLWHEPFADGFLGANSYKDMVAEWIVPTEQHGTEFVFMPTLDDLRQRPNADPVRTKEYVRVYATSNEETEVGYYDRLGVLIPGQSTNIKNGEFSHESRGDASFAIPYVMSEPGQAYQSPRSVTQFNGTTGSGNFIGASYNSWSTYMVELVPREQWVSYSPFKAPSYPSGMKHYLNIVTDSTNRFNVYIRQGNSGRQLVLLNRDIPGTDLIWGKVDVNSGVNYVVEADDEARFGGFVYGNYKGYELYRPGGAKKDGDDDKDIATAGGGDSDLPEVLHPSEYEEETGLMYGFPLAPSRCVLAPPDVYDVKVEQDCDEMIITIEAQNENPSGLKFIRLVNDRDITFNTRLEFIEPGSALELREKNIAKAVIRLVAINPLQDAKAVVEFKDRTREGKVQRVEFEYESERVDVDPAEGIDFGKLTINFPAGEQAITITNPLNKDVVVKNLGFVFGNQEFEITRTEPMFDWDSDADSVILKSQETMKIWIDITPKDENRIYTDSLKITLGCVEITVPLRAATVQPCIFVSDLDFGTLAPNESKTLPLKICNNGDGEITFKDPWLTWLATEFTVADTEIDKLRTTTLGPVDGSGPANCVTIMVTFSSPATGNFRTEATFHSSAPAVEGDGCRDISIWTAIVTEPGPGLTGYDWKERWLSSRNPCTKNDTEQYEWDIEVSNSGDAAFTVESLVIIDNPDGVFEIIDPGSVTPGKQMNPGVTELVRVAFRPMEEKVYQAKVQLNYRIDGVLSDEPVERFLDGIGIESYVTITDQSYGKHQFTGPGTNTVTQSVFLQSTGTRDVTITNISIKGADAADFRNITLVNNPPNTLPLTLAPNETQEVEVTFDAQDTDPLLKNATIDLEGDFAYANCSETDSSGALDGEVFTLGAQISGWTFPSILTCFEDDGNVTVTNTGTDPIEIINISQAQPTDQGITVDFSGLTFSDQNPIVLQAGEVLQIPVHFAPTDPGNYSANVTVTIRDTDGDGQDEELVAPVSGTARQITINFSIPEGYTQFPGLPLTISVNMTTLNGDDPAEARISHFFVQVYYNDGMMLVDKEKFRLGEQFPESEGWTITEFERAPGYIIFEIENTAGNFIDKVEGEVLQIDFITFIGDVTETSLDPVAWLQPGGFGMNNNNCVLIDTTFGNARLDEVCGLNFRLIEAAASKYSVGNAHPNIASTTTDVTFSLGLDAHTTIELFNQQGDKVGVLVNEYLNPGSYSVTWDVSTLPVGTYYYRITSGHWTGTQEVKVHR